jgi:hypothetical protein
MAQAVAQVDLAREPAQDSESFAQLMKIILAPLDKEHLEAILGLSIVHPEGMDDGLT